MQPKSSKFKHNSDQKQGRSFRKLKWDKPSPTVAYGHREIHVHPAGKRRLSIFEAMRLQGFPDYYELLGNFSKQVSQISDAVPPPMASKIAETIQTCLYNNHRIIQKKLLRWFKVNQRTFPWRETADPYAILVAEKLLQQTSANQVLIDAYREVLSMYPDLYALAQAEVKDIESIISPLGLNYRASELPNLACEILEHFGGYIPASLKELLELSGIGDYIARAVLCFAFGRAVPIVDTNVARFLHRLFGLNTTLPSNPARNRFLIDLASNLVPKTHSKEFNLAVLDLCAQLCTTSNPNCDVCPVKKECFWSKKHHPTRGSSKGL